MSVSWLWGYHLQNVTLGGKQGEVCEESIFSCNRVIIYHYFKVSFKNTENLIDRQQERTQDFWQDDIESKDMLSTALILAEVDSAMGLFSDSLLWT